MKHRVLGVLPLSFAFACGPPVEPDGTPGALHSGTFVYCETKDTCDDVPIPDHIAVDTSFVLSFSYDGAALEGDGLHVAATRNDDGSTTFRALEPGSVKITATDEDGTLLDYIRVSLSDATSLRVAQCPRSFDAIRTTGDEFDPRQCAGAPATTALELSRGASLAPTLCARLIDAEGEELGGAFDVRWTLPATSPLLPGFPAEPSGALELAIARDPRCASVGALALGVAPLVLSAAGFITVLPVTVSR